MDRGTGVFKMEDVNKVVAMPLAAAKQFANEIVDAQKLHMHKENIEKAKKMIDRSRNTTSLALGMSNFILAHIDPSLKVVQK